MKLVYYIKRIFQLPAVEIKLLIKGYLICLFLLPIVYFFPLKSYISCLKLKTKAPIPEDQVKYYVQIIRKTMRRINRFSPVKFTCLIKSATFKILLNDFGIESSLALGLNISDDKLLRAHAYIKMDDKVIFLKNENFKDIHLIP